MSNYWIYCSQPMWKSRFRTSGCGRCEILQLYRRSNSSSFPDILAEPPKFSSGSSNPSVDFITNMHSLRKGASKICESVHIVKPFPLTVMMGSVYGVSGTSWFITSLQTDPSYAAFLLLCWRFWRNHPQEKITHFSII